MHDPSRPSRKGSNADTDRCKHELHRSGKQASVLEFIYTFKKHLHLNLVGSPVS